MPARIRRRITSSRRDEIEKEQEEQSQQIIRPFENVHGFPVSYAASSQSSFLNQPLTIKDTAVLYLSLMKSRSNYLKLCPMFQLYWVKQSSYIKKLMEQDKPIPEHLKKDDVYANRSCILNNDVNARDIMVKLLECGLSMGVHFFEIRVFIAKDERSDTKEEKERMKREREEKKAQREQEKLERKIKREQESKEREERKLQKEIEKREEQLKRKEEQGSTSLGISRNINENQEKGEGSKNLAKSSKTGSKGKKDASNVKEEANSKPKAPVSNTSSSSNTSNHGDLQSPDNQRMIANLNYIGSKNKGLNDLMNEVASGRSTTNQVSLFQKYIREAKLLGPPPHSDEVINELVLKIDNEVIEELRLAEEGNNKEASSGQDGNSQAPEPQNEDVTRKKVSGKNTAKSSNGQGPSDGPTSDKAYRGNLDIEGPSHSRSGIFVKSEQNNSVTYLADPASSQMVIDLSGKKKKMLKKDIPKDQKLTAFQEKYLFNATVLFEFLENPNVRFQFPKFAICEVIEPSTQFNSDNGDNSDNKDILVSFLWIHNQKAMDNYEAELKQYESKIKEQEESDRKAKLEEEEEEKSKIESENKEELAEKSDEENSATINSADMTEENSESKEDATVVVTKQEDETDTVQEQNVEEQAAPAKRRAPPPRRGKKRRRGHPPKKSSAPKPLSPPEEPVYSFSSVSFTIHGIPNKFVPIFVNSLDPVDKVRSRMEHILETGNRITPYQLWYQVDGKLDADLAENARVSLKQEEKKMTGIPTIQEKVEPKKYPKKKKPKEVDQSGNKQTSEASSIVVKAEPSENATASQEARSNEAPVANTNVTQDKVEVHM
ncbi:SWC3 [Candida metapsilosis]|uniref:SWC3 n=1 Tax=Candida metapsilosis TaxID=273372 RepID=A0A8H7ZE79_9ASCO|nr:SWC3 [Candida metapsilosis]